MHAKLVLVSHHFSNFYTLIRVIRNRDFEIPELGYKELKNLKIYFKSKNRLMHALLVRAMVGCSHRVYIKNILQEIFLI